MKALNPYIEILARHHFNRKLGTIEFPEQDLDKVEDAIQFFNARSFCSRFYKEELTIKVEYTEEAEWTI